MNSTERLVFVRFACCGIFANFSNFSWIIFVNPGVSARKQRSRAATCEVSGADL